MTFVPHLYRLFANTTQERRLLNDSETPEGPEVANAASRELREVLDAHGVQRIAEGLRKNTHEAMVKERTATRQRFTETFNKIVAANPAQAEQLVKDINARLVVTPGFVGLHMNRNAASGQYALEAIPGFTGETMQRVTERLRPGHREAFEEMIRDAVPLSPEQEKQLASVVNTLIPAEMRNDVITAMRLVPDAELRQAILDLGSEFRPQDLQLLNTVFEQIGQGIEKRAQGDPFAILREIAEIGSGVRSLQSRPLVALNVFNNPGNYLGDATLAPIARILNGLSQDQRKQLMDLGMRVMPRIRRVSELGQRLDQTEVGGMFSPDRPSNPGAPNEQSPAPDTRITALARQGDNPELAGARALLNSRLLAAEARGTLTRDMITQCNDYLSRADVVPALRIFIAKMAAKIDNDYALAGAVTVFFMAIKPPSSAALTPEQEAKQKEAKTKQEQEKKEKEQKEKKHLEALNKQLPQIGNTGRPATREYNFPATLASENRDVKIVKRNTDGSVIKTPLERTVGSMATGDGFVLERKQDGFKLTVSDSASTGTRTLEIGGNGAANGVERTFSVSAGSDAEVQAKEKQAQAKAEEVAKKIAGIGPIVFP